MILQKSIAAALGAASLTLAAAVEPSIAAPVGSSAIRAAVAPSLIERAGCYRWGETGYHWYRFCLGPSWLYPHRPPYWRHCWWHHGRRYCR